MKTGKIKMVLVIIVVTILTVAILGLIGAVAYFKNADKDMEEPEQPNLFELEAELKNPMLNRAIGIMTVSSKDYEFNVNEVKLNVSIIQNVIKENTPEETLQNSPYVYPAVDFHLERSEVAGDFLKDFDREYYTEYYAKCNVKETVRRETEIFTSKYFEKPFEFELTIPEKYFVNRCGFIRLGVNICAIRENNSALIPEIGDEDLMKNFATFIIGYVRYDDDVMIFTTDEIKLATPVVPIDILLSKKFFHSDPDITNPFSDENFTPSHCYYALQFIQMVSDNDEEREALDAFCVTLFDEWIPTYVERNQAMILNTFMAILKNEKESTLYENN